MLDFRLRAYDIFMKKPCPHGEQILVRLIFKTYSIMQRPQKKLRKVHDVPEDVKNPFKLIIPEAEKKF